MCDVATCWLYLNIFRNVGKCLAVDKFEHPRTLESSLWSLLLGRREQGGKPGCSTRDKRFRWYSGILRGVEQDKGAEKVTAVEK